MSALKVAIVSALLLSTLAVSGPVHRSVDETETAPAVIEDGVSKNATAAAEGEDPDLCCENGTYYIDCVGTVHTPPSDNEYFCRLHGGHCSYYGVLEGGLAIWCGACQCKLAVQ